MPACHCVCVRVYDGGQNFPCYSLSAPHCSCLYKSLPGQPSDDGCH